ncbi:metal cation transporter P-type ATPase CtpF [Mycobacterium tuberculosis M1026]|nr:metal cation transporter P-type ATPase CtpF [Mycobacterium tuberculosis M1026]
MVLLLESDPYHGLSDGEAAQRLERFGPNTLAVVTRASLLARILRQFHHPLIYVLLVAGTITAGLKEFVDAAVIFGVVVINAIVGFIQESKAEANNPEPAAYAAGARAAKIPAPIMDPSPITTASKSPSRRRSSSGISRGSSGRLMPR